MFNLIIGIYLSLHCICVEIAQKNDSLLQYFHNSGICHRKIKKNKTETSIHEKEFTLIILKISGVIFGIYKTSVPSKRISN